MDKQFGFVLIAGWMQFLHLSARFVGCCYRLGTIQPLDYYGFSDYLTEVRVGEGKLAPPRQGRGCCEDCQEETYPQG